MSEAKRELMNQRPVRGGAPPPMKQVRIGIVAHTQGFVVGTSPTKVLPQNNRREYILIQNKSASSIFFSFGAFPDINFFNAHEITAGGSYETNTACPISDVFIVSAVADLSIAITEGVRA